MYITVLFLFSTANTLLAQQKIATKNNNKRKILGDTTTVYYTQLSNPTLVLPLDASLDNFEEIDPTWNEKENFATLGGLLATPALDRYYQSKSKGGFRVGFNQFDHYKLERESIKYYEVKDHRPFTELYYSQINQKNNFVKADFGYRFNDNIYIGLQYDLINQNGFYKQEKVRNQNVGFALRVKTNDARYQGYFNFVTNAIKYQDNGGITSDTIIGDLVEAALLNVNTYSSSAQSNYNTTNLTYSQFWYNKGVDSLKQTTNATNEWSHKISYQFNRYKFFDNAPNPDIYGDAAVNPRGLRVFVRHQVLENEIGYRQALGGSLQEAPLWLKAYVKHSWNIVYQQPQNYQIHNFSVGAIIQNNPQYQFKYRIEGQATSVESRLDLMLKAKVGYDLKKFGYLQGQLLFQRYQPSLIDRQLYVSNELIWDNNLNFLQIQEFNFGGKYTLPTIGFEAELLNHTFTNWIYYDSLGVQQAPSSVNLLQLKIKQNFKVWKFHLDNEVIWQPTLAGKAYFRVPELLFSHNFYLQSEVFNKAMLLKIGVRFRYNTAYYANGYDPLTGNFFIQNRQLIDMTPRIDPYISFRIWQFRFFVRGENVLYFANGENYFTAYRRPIHNFVVRLGVSWRLFD